MQRNHEVEYRALLDKKIFNNFINIGRKSYPNSFKGPLIIRDAYLCSKHVQNFQEIEMDKIGSYSLRLRQEITNNKSVITLNTKIIQNAGDHNAWLEYEVDVSSYVECKKILETIGFKIFFEIKKRRYSFQDGEIHVFLEDIENFQPAIEIEILTSANKAEIAKQKLLKYFESHSIGKDAIVKKSITNTLMKEWASF